MFYSESTVGDFKQHNNNVWGVCGVVVVVGGGGGCGGGVIHAQGMHMFIDINFWPQVLNK